MLPPYPPEPVPPLPFDPRWLNRSERPHAIPPNAMATKKIHVDANRGERPINCGEYAISRDPGSSFLTRLSEDAP